MAVGSGAAGARTIKLKKPGAPTEVTAVPLYEGAQVSWSPPASDGGASITGYTVTASAGGQTCTTTGATTCALSGLKVSHKYSIEVRASNSVGLGRGSAKIYVNTDGYCTYIGAATDLQNCVYSGDNLTGVNLAGSNLTGAKFIFATLTDANLTGTNLTGADLTGVYSGGIIGTPSALPSQWAFFNGYLVGASTSLDNADLANADLQGVALNSAFLDGANLEGANLSGIWGQDADFDGADLTNANMTGATLVDTIFDNANLTGVNFTNAYMVGFIGNGGTVFGDNIWSNTTCPDNTNSDQDGGTCTNDL